MVYDPNSPDPDHAGLSDIDQIKENLNKLRSNEAGSNEPADPVAGMFWMDTYASTYVMKVRNKANDAWLTLFELTASGMTEDHIADNITDSNTVHGIQQGSGNGFDADKLDGVEGADYAKAPNIPMGFKAYAGNDIMIDSNDTERTTSSVAFVKLKEYTLHKAPNATIRFSAYAWMTGASDGYLKIYKNGGFVSGSDRDVTTTPTTFTWDIGSIGDGDTIELWASSTVGYGTIHVQDFRMLGQPYVENTYDQDA